MIYTRVCNNTLQSLLPRADVWSFMFTGGTYINMIISVRRPLVSSSYLLNQLLSLSDSPVQPLLRLQSSLHSPQSCSSEPEKNFPGIFTVEILLEWMESFKRGKSVLRKLGRTETGYFSRRSQPLQIELQRRGGHSSEINSQLLLEQKYKIRIVEIEHF